MADPQQPDFIPSETPDFIPISQDSLKSYASQQTADPMAAANVRMALANVPRPASPIPSEPNIAPMAGQAAVDVLGNIANYGKQALKSAYDTSAPGAMGLIYQKNFGNPQQQAEATQRLHAAAKTAVSQYAMGGMTGEAALPESLYRQPGANLVPRLLNASGDLSPETLADLKTAEPVLQTSGRPGQMTQAGVAQHVRNLSQQIDSQIKPVIEANASRDVSADTAQIAQKLRAQITPEMKNVNPGAANALERVAKSVEQSKDLASLDELRQQLNDKNFASKPNAIVRPYFRSTLNDVLDTIANHAQQARPDLPVRQMRTQQSALMRLADTFDEAAAKSQVQAASQAGLSRSQKALQSIPNAVQAVTNPKMALLRRLAQPATAEQNIRGAFSGYGSQAGSLVRSVTQTPGLSNLDLENIVRRAPGTEAEQQAIQARQAQQSGLENPLRRKFGAPGINPNASPAEIMDYVRQTRPDLFTAKSPNPQVPEWPAEYQNAPKTLSSEGEGGANYTADQLAEFKRKHGIK